MPDNDPFAGMGGSAFDAPISKPKPKTVQSSANVFVSKTNKFKPSPLKKMNSDNIILDMFAQAAPPDPNLKKKKKAKPKRTNIQKTQSMPEKNQKIVEESNPFGDDLSNPFGDSIGNIKKDENNNEDTNPFDALGDPFGTSTENVMTKGDETNPFEALDDPFASTDNLKTKSEEEFMADRDPFAGM